MHSALPPSHRLSVLPWRPGLREGSRRRSRCLAPAASGRLEPARDGKNSRSPAAYRSRARDESESWEFPRKGCPNVVSPVPESAPHGEPSYSRNCLCHGKFFGYRPKTRSVCNQLASHGSGSYRSVVKWSMAPEQLPISLRSFLTSAFSGLHSKSLHFQMLQNRYYYFLETGLPFCQWPFLH